MIYWFTGQPGSGKTVLGNLLKEYNDEIYKDVKYPVKVIDGDVIREKYNNKDYSEAGRRKNIKLAQNLAYEYHQKKYDVIVALVSPYLDMREAFKAEMGNDIKEIYVQCFEERERDHYHVDNYEEPLADFIYIDTTDDTPSESLIKILKEI